MIRPAAVTGETGCDDPAGLLALRGVAARYPLPRAGSIRFPAAA